MLRSAGWSLYINARPAAIDAEGDADGQARRLHDQLLSLWQRLLTSLKVPDMERSMHAAQSLHR